MIEEAQVVMDDGRHAFAFQDTVSYVLFGSRLKLKADHDEITVYFLDERDVDGLEDVHGITRAVTEAAERARSLGYPVLPELRDGWTSAS